MQLENEDIKALLLSPKDSKTHWISDCPACGAAKHFYVRKKTTLLNKRGENRSFYFDCKKCKEEGGLFTLLKLFGKEDLYDVKKKVGEELNLNFSTSEEINEEMVEPREILNPIGFKRIFEDEYLQSRGFKEIDFYRYEIGYTRIKVKLQKYILLMVQQNFKNRGYIARCMLKEGDKNYENYKRYQNSSHDFGKMLFGYDEVIKGKTKEVVVTEGLFDKNSADHALDLNSGYEMKGVSSFGSKFSEYQMLLLKAKGIEDVLIVYDIDAIKEIKKYSMLAKKMFKRVRIAFTTNKDLNASTDEEIRKVFDGKKYDPIYFSDNFVSLPKFN